MNWQELLNSGELEGYTDSMYNDIDADVATRTPCEECGGKCEYHGMENGRNSYRAFSVCADCGRVIEF
jgi:hypothetical protein